MVSHKYKVYCFSIPLWIPTALCGVLAWMIHRALNLQSPGHCHQCGYDLFGNTSGVCPECGTPIPKDVREKLAAEPPGGNIKIDTHGSSSVDEMNV